MFSPFMSRINSRKVRQKHFYCFWTFSPGGCGLEGAISSLFGDWGYSWLLMLPVILFLLGRFRMILARMRMTVMTWILCISGDFYYVRTRVATFFVFYKLCLNFVFLRTQYFILPPFTTLKFSFINTLCGTLLSLSSKWEYPCMKWRSLIPERAVKEIVPR